MVKPNKILEKNNEQEHEQEQELWRYAFGRIQEVRL